MTPRKTTPRALAVRLRLVAALLGPLVVAGCRPKTTVTSVPAGTPVVLISIDTLRADHLPAYGYAGVATPAIDALRKDAVLFERAYSHTPLTLPSHTTLLTGLLPSITGVRDNVGYSLDAKRVQSGELPYLPFLLQQKGYKTGAAVSAYVLRSITGLATGFDFYQDAIEFKSRTGLGGLQRTGGETLQAALPWLRGVEDKPFFFFLPLRAAHRTRRRSRSPRVTPSNTTARSPRPMPSSAADRRAQAQWCLRQGDGDPASDHGEGLGDTGRRARGAAVQRGVPGAAVAQAATV